MPLQMQPKILMSNSMMMKIKSMLLQTLKVSEAEPFLVKMSWQLAPHHNMSTG